MGGVPRDQSVPQRDKKQIGGNAIETLDGKLAQIFGRGEVYKISKAL